MSTSTSDATSSAGNVSTHVERLILVARPVRNLRLVQDFYCEALGFEVIEIEAASEASSHRLQKLLANAWRTTLQGAVMLAAGSQRLLLLAAEDMPPADPDSGASDTRFQHIAVVVGNMDAAWQRLLRADSALRCVGNGGPQLLPASSGGVRAVKFRDPEGHPVELLAFPASRVASPWNAPQPKSAEADHILGIDHSALTVASADASIAFYTARLGLQLQNRQTNRGPEQGDLDGLDEPVVEVVAMQAGESATPHLELLAYTQPHAAPAFSDAVHARAGPRTTLVWQDAAPVAGLAETSSSGDLGFCLEDPDGHIHLVLPQAGSPVRPVS